MSLLLAGPNRITEWIEKSAFDAIVKGPDSVEYRPKLVQVLSRGGRGWMEKNSDADGCCPPYLVIHDGLTSTAAFLSQKAQEDLGMMQNRAAQEATKGCIVRVSGWSVSTVQVCAENTSHFSHLTQPPPNTTRFSSLNRLLSLPLCLVIEKVETLGAQGMGIIGNAVDINEAIQVRRALQSIQHNYNTLCQRLNLEDNFQEEVPVGDVAKLDASDFSQVLEAGSSLPQEPDTVPVGNVEDLFNAANNDESQQDNPLVELFGLAEQQQRESHNTPSGHETVANPSATEGTAAGQELHQANENIGSVSQLLQNDSQASENPFEDILALAEQQRQAEETTDVPLQQQVQDSAIENEKQDPAPSRSFLGRLSDIFSSATRRLSPSQLSRKSTQEPRTAQSIESEEVVDDEQDEESEDGEIVGISEMLLTQQDQNHKDEGALTESEKTEKGIRTRDQPRTWIVQDMRPLKRHKVSSDFFSEIMRLGREDYKGTISAEARSPKNTTGDIRSWLDCHVQAC